MPGVVVLVGWTGLIFVSLAIYYEEWKKQQRLDGPLLLYCGFKNCCEKFSCMSPQKVVFLSAAAILFLSLGTASTDWLEKPVWQDRPGYAEDLSISIAPTDLIQEREYREVCIQYSNTTLDNGTTIQECDSYQNESYAGSIAGVYDITNRDVVYLGDGYVSSNVTVSLNRVSKNTLKESFYLMGEDTYLGWFNSNYFYNGGNMTVSDLDSLQESVQGLSPEGENTDIVASRVNTIDLDSGSADMTLIFRFNNFRSGVLTVSDLFNVEVESSIE